MKNIVITIIIDSFTNTAFSNDLDFQNICPFMYHLSKTKYYYENMFSQGPFTEAGIKSLMSGKDVLDDENYIFRLNKSPQNVFKYFKEKGYENTVLFYPTNLFSKEILKNIDNKVYTSCFWYEGIYNNKLDYLINVLKNKTTATDYDFKKFSELLSYVFESWISYLNEGDYSLIEDIMDKQAFELENEQIHKEYEKFCSNRVDYLDKIINDAGGCKLFDFQSFQPIKFDKIRKNNNYKRQFKRIEKKSKRYNFIYNRILTDIITDKKINKLKSILGYKYYISFKIQKKYNMFCNDIRTKTCSSCKKQLSYIEEKISKEADSTKKTVLLCAC